MSLIVGSGVLVPLGSGGGAPPEGVSLVGGTVEPGPASLLPGVGGLGGALEVGLGVLGWGESLVGGGSLVPLGSGGGVGDAASLDGTVESGPVTLLAGIGLLSLEPGPGVLGALG